MTNRIVTALVILSLAAACTKPIRKVELSNYGWGPQKGVTLAQIQRNVEQTAIGLGWELSDVKTGSFIARRSWDGDKHNVAVDVVYDAQRFSIRYKDSKAMSYNGRSIHHTYNDMVELLRDKIKTNISTLQP
jgi:hypothetical protein